MNLVWSIAGSDSGGGAGIQADAHTFQDFGVHGCTVITAITAQNTQTVSHIHATSLENLDAQIQALKNDLIPQAIKLGMLYDAAIIQCVANHLQSLNIPIIADPVLVSTTQSRLSSDDFIQAYQQYILPMATLLTPNVHEAQSLCGIEIHTHADMEMAAQKLLSMGAKAVLIKGGDLPGQLLVASDFYADAHSSFWINLPRVSTPHTHGTGCTLSAAITAAIAQGWSLLDAIVLAKAYVHAGLTHCVSVGKGQRPIGHVGLGALNQHFPWISTQPQALPPSFKKLDKPIGRYPIVDNLEDLAALCSKGISYIQLRIKHPGEDFEEICRTAQEVAKSFGVNLIINDHFIDNIPGTHLGQEDLFDFDQDAHIILGISSHNLFEMAKAYAYHPSYLAIGPIFETQSKILHYPPIGLDKLKTIIHLCPLPLVAIGGIPYQQIPEILEMGCSGVAFINATKDLKQDGRFDRHFSLPTFSPKKQQQLAQAQIVCIGAGGLASGFLPYLAGAGVGHITLIDHDKVSYSNLQRQILYAEKDIGKLKIDRAAEFLSQLNSQLCISKHATKLNLDNAPDLLKGYDLIIDGTDNYDAHYLINDTARLLKTPLISAAVFHDQGQLFYFSPLSGCYRCLFPNPPQSHERPSCDTAGVLGTTPGLLGIMQAQLAIAYLTGDVPASSFCRTVPMQHWQIKTLSIHPSQICPTCQSPLSLNTLRSLNMTSPLEQISAQALKDELDAGHAINLLDVREDNERETFNIGGTHIPIQVLPERIYELDPSLPYVVYCRSGGRSTMACEFLMNQGFKVKNLTGGILAWQDL